MLIKSGADVDQRRPHSQTALEIAIIDDNLDMVKRLVAAGADVNNCDDALNSPLDKAFYHASPDVFNFLRSVGAVWIDIKVRILSEKSYQKVSPGPKSL